MANAQLATYLTDHRTGADGAVELLQRLESALAGAVGGNDVAALRADVVADRRELEGLMTRLGIAPGRIRRAAARLAGRLSWLLIRHRSASDPLHLLEGFEAIALGIEGKRALWRTLAAVAATSPKLRGLDYARLERRAEDQQERVESLRLRAALTALTGVEPNADEEERNS